MSKPRVVLVILDGWGIGPDYAGNAITKSQTPTLAKIRAGFPHTELLASGEAVGLPKGEDGNTETGHLNIGAGRIVYQDLPRINMAIANDSFFENKAFQKVCAHVIKNSSALHLIGLIGQGGVHSSNDHLYALLRLAKKAKITHLYLHLITDGRDSSPTSSCTYLQEVSEQLKNIGIGQIATIVGRYYAMDRDHRWERTQVAYDAMVAGIGEEVTDINEAIESRYQTGMTDEFITPLFPAFEGKTAPRICSHDGVIFFNYRIDRPRQLTRAFVEPNASPIPVVESFDPYAVKYNKSHLDPKTPPSPIFSRSTLLTDLCFVTMTEYIKDLPVEVAFPPTYVEMPLSRVLAMSGKRQLKLAESEKERFVTYYFNGQRELPFPGEDVQITPSPKVPTYDLAPAMSGDLQTAKLATAIRSGTYDFIVINYPNPDMVAHTGNLEATIQACEYVDSWLATIYRLVVQDENLTLLITADHGNAEELISLDTGKVDTEHSKFPVPLYIVNQKLISGNRILPKGILADVAPTILKILGVNKPTQMTGQALL